MIEYNIQNSIGFIQLNRPEVYNALVPEMMMKLSNVLDECMQNSLVQVVVLSGNGKSFCAGADIHWMKASADASEEQNMDDSRLLANLFQKIHASKKPIVCAVHGPVYGGGIGIMAACDVIVAEETAQFKFSEVRLGITPSTILPHIVRRMGLQRAKVKIMTAELFDAKHALQNGLVDYVVKNNANEYAHNVAKDILKGSPDAHAETKQLLETIASSKNAEAFFDATIQSLAKIKKTKNAAEGLNAFIEKRKPIWNS